MKNAKNYREWTNQEIEDDPQGYVRAQQATRRHEARESARAAEEADKHRYVTAFVAGGGTRYAAAEAYEAHRDAQAAQVAEQGDEQARRHYAAATRRVI